MTFVFEACELPFGDITESYASRVNDIVATFAVHHLPLWDRCLLAAVLPIVLQRRRTVTAALAETEARLGGTENEEEAAPAGPARDGGDVADASEIPQGTQQPNRSRASPSSAAAQDAPVTLADVEVALDIVRQLDELEEVYGSILTTRREHVEQQQQQQQLKRTTDASTSRASPLQLKKTSEEIIMEQLLQERFSDTAPYLPESDTEEDESGERASAADVVDVAMCFTAQGESLGIGSSAVFGGHGYHPR